MYVLANISTKHTTCTFTHDHKYTPCMSTFLEYISVLLMYVLLVHIICALYVYVEDSVRGKGGGGGREGGGGGGGKPSIIMDAAVGGV